MPGERNCCAGQVCKGPWVSALFWVYLLLTRYSRCNPTRGWHNATSNIFGQDCGTMIRLWEWAKLHAHKMDYAEWCYSAAFEMQRQQLTELMWATQIGTALHAWQLEKQDFSIQSNNNLLEADSRKMGTNRFSQTPDSDEWRRCIKHLRESNQKMLLLHVYPECSKDRQPLIGNRLLHLSQRAAFTLLCSGKLNLVYI